MARSFPSTIGGVTVIDLNLAPSGGDVSTYQGAWDWIYSNYPDLTSANRIIRVKVTGEFQSDTSSITIGGSIVGDSTRYIIFTAAEGQSVCDEDATTTAINWNASKARFTTTSNVFAVPFPIPSISSKVVVEALQFRKVSAGDGVLISSPTGVDLVTRSNIFYTSTNSAGTSCIYYNKSLHSYNDVVLIDNTDSSYPTVFSPEISNTSSYISDVHNTTVLKGNSSYNGSLGLGGTSNSTATGSLCCNVLLLTGSDAALHSNWNANSNAISGSDGSSGGTNLVTNVNVNDTVESATTGALDARMKASASSSLVTGGYDNLTENPIDFFYRPRSSSGYNRGAYDPNAESPGGDPTIEITDFYAAGPDLGIDYNYTSSGSSPQIKVYLEKDGNPVTPEPTTSSLTGTFFVSNPGPGVYSLVSLEITDSYGTDNDGPWAGDVEIIGIGEVEIEGEVDVTLGSISITATATVQGGINGEVNETLGNLTVISEAVINTQITGTLSKTLKNATLNSKGYVGEVPPPPTTGYTIGGPYLTLNISLTMT